MRSSNTKIKTVRLFILGIFLTLLISSCKNKNQNAKEKNARSTTETIVENYYSNITADTTKTYYTQPLNTLIAFIIQLNPVILISFNFLFWM
jgi:hypothetical protein